MLEILFNLAFSIEYDNKLTLLPSVQVKIFLGCNMLFDRKRRKYENWDG